MFVWGIASFLSLLDDSEERSVEEVGWQRRRLLRLRLWTERKRNGHFEEVADQPVVVVVAEGHFEILLQLFLLRGSQRRERERIVV